MAWKAPAIGQFRSRLRIERRGETIDQFGNPQLGWVPVIPQIAACVVPSKGGETVQAARLEGKGSYDITIHRSASTEAITVSDRAVDLRSGRTFNIQWCESLDAASRFLTLACQSGGAD